MRQNLPETFNTKQIGAKIIQSGVRTVFPKGYASDLCNHVDMAKESSQTVRQGHLSGGL